MKKLLCALFLTLLATTTWGCLALDLDQAEPGETGTELQAQQPAAVDVQPQAQDREAASAPGAPGDIDTEAYYPCEGKSCGDPCGTGGYVCNIFGECTRENPACD